MVVTMHYENSVEVFDTSERVDPATYAGNALTNWSLRLEDARSGDALGGKRLWLDCRAHELPASDDGVAGPSGLAVARRRDVACFLLADESDVACLLRVAVNGETVLLRAGDEFVNAVRFAHAADLTGVYNPQAVAACAYFETAMESDSDSDPYEAARSMLGYPSDALALAERMENADREHERASDWPAT